MKCSKTENMDKFDIYIDKPSDPFVMASQVELTEEEYRKQHFVEEQLSLLGISTSVFDTDNGGYENPYILEAVVVANNGEEIPEELKIKIKETIGRA